MHLCYYVLQIENTAWQEHCPFPQKPLEKCCDALHCRSKPSLIILLKNINSAILCCPLIPSLSVRVGGSKVVSQTASGCIPADFTAPQPHHTADGVLAPQTHHRLDFSLMRTALWHEIHLQQWPTFIKQFTEIDLKMYMYKLFFYTAAKLKAGHMFKQQMKTNYQWLKKQSWSK